MSKRKTSLPDPDDVLAGRARPSAAELLQLIHRENPTGRELGAPATELRYARKARLQSLLVRRFGADLEVAADPALPGTVSLRHRGHGRDACHAIVAALDDDARSWVQRELDLAAPDEALPVRSAPRANAPSANASRAGDDADEDVSPEGLVRKAEAALEEYDYETARATLERALAESGGAARPAAALLGLLVDTLGDDAAALAIEGSIDKAALSEPRVRTLLALAAARSGHDERAVVMSRGLDDASAAGIFAALAARALAAGDADRAAAHIEQAKRHDAASSEVTRVADEVDKARALARAPREAEIAALLAEGRDVEAETNAHEVLSRWPGSATARRALHEIEERRRSHEAARLVREAKEAAGRGDIAVARARLSQAISSASGAAREAIEALASAIESEERARHEAEQLDRTIGRLGAGDAREGLALYAALPDALRTRVRERVPRQELGWIEQMASVRAEDRAKADAAVALSTARASLERDPKAALAQIAPHEAILDRVPEARRIKREAEAALRAERLEAAREALAAARADMAAGAVNEARSRLLGVVLRELSDEERAEAAAIEAAAARIVERRRRGEEVERLRAAGRLFEARTAAEGLAASAEQEDERARWVRTRDAVEEDIQRTFRVDTDDAPRSNEELGRFRPLARRDEALCWLTPDGREIVFAQAFERWVIVRVLDRASMEVRPTILLRTPEPLDDLDTTVCGQTLWLVGGRGAMVEIDMSRWHVRDFRPSSDVAAPNDVLEMATLVVSEDRDAPRYLWIAQRPRGWTFCERTRVIDLASRRVVRELPEVWQATRILGLHEPRVVTRRDQKITVHAPRGAIVPPSRIESELSIQNVAAHPAGEGLIALMTEPMDGPFEDARSLYAATISAAGSVEAKLELSGADPDRISAIAAARGSHRIYATARDGEAAFLTAIDLTGAGSLTKLYEIEVSNGMMFVQDAGARRIVALTLHDGGVDAVELGEMAPELPLRPGRPIIPIPGSLDVLSCDHPSGSRDTGAKALATLWRGVPEAAIAREVREREHAASVRPEELVEIVFALRSEVGAGRKDAADRLVQRLGAKFPDHPEVRLLLANQHALADRWAEAHAALVGIEDAELDEARAQHLHHLRALAALGAGRFDEAREEVAAARAHEGRCGLASLDALTSGDVGAASGDEPDPSALLELMGIVRAADDRFAANDLEGARRVLDQPLVWIANEAQSLARLAETYLAWESTSRAEHVRKLVTLGAFCDQLDESRPRDRRSLPLVGAWDSDRLADIAARARAWLDAQGAPR
jgi:hypothetical protein